MKLTSEQKEAIMNMALDDSTRIIRYMEEQAKKRKKYDLAVLVFTIISAIGAIIAAVTSILAFFQ